MNSKKLDLEKLAAGLDISPTMYKYAVDRYKSIAHYLEDLGIHADFYPQGSFRTGTVVRPLRNGKDADFDIDVVCEFSVPFDTLDPAAVKMVVGNALQKNKDYSDKLDAEDDRCWTLQFADVSDGVGLKMDIVPCAHENNSGIMNLCLRGVQTEFAQQAIEITEKQGAGHYEWISSNPGGYGAWFDQINSKFLKPAFFEKKSVIFNENRKIFASVEEVPDGYVHSSLQRVIQLLKRHRDLYYQRSKVAENLWPQSIIITTLAAQIAQKASPMDTDELLSYVISGMADYAALLLGKRPLNESAFETKTYIAKDQQKWVIRNPVNPDDNYADSWTDETATKFFQWISVAKADLCDFDSGHAKYRVGLESAFGSEYVSRVLGRANESTSRVTATHSVAPTLSRPTKPWRPVE